MPSSMTAGSILERISQNPFRPIAVKTIGGTRIEINQAEDGLLPFHVVKESVGFIYNRIWAAIKRESLAVVA